MASLHSPTTMLIIPLILNTFSAPDNCWAPTILEPQEMDIVHHTADEPQDDLSSGSSAGSHSWLPPMGTCSDRFGIVDTTDSSVPLLLLVSLPDRPGRPGDGDQLVRRHNPAGRCKREANHTFLWTQIPLEPLWASLPVEAGSYGVPPHQAREESFLSSYPFLSNTTLEVSCHTLSNSSSSLPPTPTMNQHHVEAAPTLYGVVLCRSADGNNGSFIQSSSLLQDGRRKISSYDMEGGTAAQPRKLLGAHGEKLGDHPQRKQSSGLVLDHRKHHRVKGTTAAAVAVASALLALLCTCTIITGLVLWCKRSNKKPEVHVLSLIRRTDEHCASAPRRYSHRELAVATRGFADEMKIGRGGFGPVYRGYLGDDRNSRHVAIKVLSPQGQGSSSAQGAKEFESEVKIMSRLRHRNIVKLLGWCDDAGLASRDHLSLVYEFVPNGTLHKHLYDPHRVLTWSDRYSIALGVGSAILYLHTECEQCVFHGDIKPENIMLDASFQPKLGDFGLARLLDHGADAQTTEVVAGTIGYIDPELVNNRRPSAMSDVYSFGIVLLEIACGKRVTTTSKAVHLLNWVRHMYHQNHSVLGAADRRLDGGFDERQMKRVLVTGLWCAHHNQSQRPSIAQAMDVLRREDDAELPEPAGPAIMLSPDAVRSLEQRAYGDFSSGEDSPCDESPAETEYHSASDDST